MLPRAGHIMNLVRQMRDGREYDSGFGTRQRGTGVYADLLAQRFAKARERLGLTQGLGPLALDKFRPPGGNGQISLF